MLRSSLDQITYVRTVHVGAADLPPGMLHDGSNPLHVARAIEICRTQDASPAAPFAEAFRYWLGLRLPYLYRHAAQALREQQLGHRLEREQTLGLDADGHLVAASHSGDAVARPLGGISAAALIDAIVALTCFRVHSPASRWLDRGAFRRWPDERAAAHAVVDVAAAVLHDGELAMRALGPLIAAAFATTRPVTAFVHFLGRLAQVAGSDHFALWRRQPEPSRWTEVFERLQIELSRAAPLGERVNDAAAEEPCTPLTMPMVLSAVPDHPVLTLPAREWARRADEAAYGWFIEQAPWAPRHMTEAIWRDFQPPATLYCVHRADGSRRLFLDLDRSSADAPGLLIGSCAGLTTVGDRRTRG